MLRIDVLEKVSFEFDALYEKCDNKMLCDKVWLNYSIIFTLCGKCGNSMSKLLKYIKKCAALS